MGIVAMKTLKGARHQNLTEFRTDAASYAQAAFRWVLSNPDVSCLVVSFSKPEHVDEYLYASGGQLDKHDLAVLERYDERIAGTYCHPHCGACLDACPEQIAINDVLRYRMYFEDYGQREGRHAPLRGARSQSRRAASAARPHASRTARSRSRFGSACWAPIGCCGWRRPERRAGARRRAPATEAAMARLDYDDACADELRARPARSHVKPSSRGETPSRRISARTRLGRFSTSAPAPDGSRPPSPPGSTAAVVAVEPAAGMRRSGRRRRATIAASGSSAGRAEALPLRDAQRVAPPGSRPSSIRCERSRRCRPRAGARPRGPAAAC